MNSVEPVKLVPVDENSEKNAAPVMVATFKIEKFADGNISYSSGGPDSDVLGLLEFGKIIIHDKTRLSIHLAQQAVVQAAQRAAAESAVEETPS